MLCDIRHTVHPVATHISMPTLSAIVCGWWDGNRNHDRTHNLPHCITAHHPNTYTVSPWLPISVTTPTHQPHTTSTHVPSFNWIHAPGHFPPRKTETARHHKHRTANNPPPHLMDTYLRTRLRQ